MRPLIIKLWHISVVKIGVLQYSFIIIISFLVASSLNFMKLINFIKSR